MTKGLGDQPLRTLMFAICTIVLKIDLFSSATAKIRIIYFLRYHSSFLDARVGVKDGTFLVLAQFEVTPFFFCDANFAIKNRHRNFIASRKVEAIKQADRMWDSNHKEKLRLLRNHALSC